MPYHQAFGKVVVYHYLGRWLWECANHPKWVGGHGATWTETMNRAEHHCQKYAERVDD